MSTKDQGVAAAALRCDQLTCGQPQNGPGHPRKGWIQTKTAGGRQALWHCSWHCVSRYAIRRELRGAA